MSSLFFCRENHLKFKSRAQIRLTPGSIWSWQYTAAPPWDGNKGFSLTKNPKLAFYPSHPWVPVHSARTRQWNCWVTGKHKRTHLYYPEQCSVCKDPQGCVFKGQILGAVPWRWESSRPRLGPGSQLLLQALGEGDWKMIHPLPTPWETFSREGICFRSS